MATPSIIPKIWAGVILIIACLAGGFLTANFYNNYSQSQAQAQVLQSKNSQLSKAVSSTDNFLVNYLKRQADAQSLNLALPAHSSDMSNFVSNLGQLAQQSGVVLAGFQINPVAGSNKIADNAIQAVSIALPASGTYSSLKDFILRLESNLRLIDITHIGLTASENGILQYRISFMTYYQK